MNNSKAKPVITIKDGAYNVTFEIVEPFTDADMVEKYTSLQAFIDMACPEKEEIDGEL